MNGESLLIVISTTALGLDIIAAGACSSTDWSLAPSLERHMLLLLVDVCRASDCDERIIAVQTTPVRLTLSFTFIPSSVAFNFTRDTSLLDAVTPQNSCL